MILSVTLGKPSADFVSKSHWPINVLFLYVFCILFLYSVSCLRPKDNALPNTRDLLDNALFLGAVRLGVHDSFCLIKK